YVVNDILMRDAFKRKRRAASRGPQHTTPAAHIRSPPNQIANALETKHGVVNKERNSVNPMRCISGTSSDERRHRPGFGNTFLEQLAVGRFLVIDQGVTIDRLIQLAHVRVDTALAE